jgi:hypothetical protein
VEVRLREIVVAAIGACARGVSLSSARRSVVRRICGLFVLCSAMALGLSQIGGLGAVIGAPEAAQASDPPTPELVFEGIGDRFPCEPGVPPDPNCKPGLTYEYDPAVGPPDTDGDVGPDHYVQVVNVAYAVFRKSDGFPIQKARATNGLWKDLPPLEDGSAHPCKTQNSGDGVVRFDRYADPPNGRWVIAQHATGGLPTLPNYFCVAVSQSGDPTGLYHQYAFQIGGNAKLGLWRDGYYVVTGPSNNRVCALERDRMLLGQSARSICRSVPGLGPSDRVLPADADGASLPPAGSPNYLLALGPVDANRNGSTLKLWKFSVNWLTGDSTISDPPLSVPVTPFTLLHTNVEVPQPESSGGLNAHQNELMNRFVYRHFPGLGRESLVVSHPVDVGNPRAGVRWYELRCVPSGSCLPAQAVPTEFQQGTFAPVDASCGSDPCWRWMSSVAMDGAGNLGIGYNVANSSTYPGVRFTGVKQGQPLAEGKIIDGTASYTGFGWGDYTSMNIDPFDDCSFWYTNQYQKDHGPNWRTTVARFKVDPSACLS